MTINHRSIRLAPFVCALLMARLCPLSAQEVFHSQHNYQIVVDRGAGPLERFAAEELKMILNKSFSMPLSVDGKTDGVIFYVGQSEASVQAGFTQVKFKDDEFGVFYRPGSFLLCGFNDTTNAFSVYGRTGTLSAVYYFAEKYLGTRFFYPGEDGVVIARDPVVKPPPAAEKVTPFFSTRSFIFRGLGYGSGLSSKDVPVRDLILFSRRLLCSRPLWQNCVPYEFSNWKDRFAQSNLLLLARNGNEPVFADYGGKKHYSPCVTSDEAAAQAADDIIRLFATRTDVPSVHYYDDVWYVPCECERCQVSPLRILGKASGDVFDPTEEYYDFLKRVGNIVFSAYPDRRLMAHTKGNRYGKSPPSQTTLDRRIVLSLYVQRQWLCDPEVANSIPGFVRRWQVATGGPVLVHSYTRYPTFFDYPLITPRHFAAYLRSLKGLIQGEFCGDIDPATPYAFSALNAWVQAKLLFDPDRDVDALINEFCALAYPGAEVEMSQFYTEMENAWAATGTQGFKVDPLKIIYNKKNLGKALRWLEVARGRVKSPASFYEKIHTAFYEFYEKAGDPALPEEAEKLERPKFITVPALSAKTVIDGAIAEREWQGSSSFSFASMEMQKRRAVRLGAGRRLRPLVNETVLNVAVDGGWTTITVPAISPWGLLVVKPQN